MQDHILIISQHLAELETHGHVEKKPAAWHHRNRAEAVIHDLELALKQDLKEDHDGNPYP